MIYNGVIRKFDLVVEDNGVFTFELLVETENCYMNCGHYIFAKGELEGFIQDLMALLGVKAMSDIINTAVRVGRDEFGELMIGHLFNNNWIHYKDYMKGC